MRVSLKFYKRKIVDYELLQLLTSHFPVYFFVDDLQIRSEVIVVGWKLFYYKILSNWIE